MIEAVAIFLYAAAKMWTNDWWREFFLACPNWFNWCNVSGWNIFMPDQSYWLTPRNDWKGLILPPSAQKILPRQCWYFVGLKLMMQHNGQIQYILCFKYVHTNNKTFHNTLEHNKLFLLQCLCLYTLHFLLGQKISFSIR